MAYFAPRRRLAARRSTGRGRLARPARRSAGMRETCRRCPCGRNSVTSDEQRRRARTARAPGSAPVNQVLRAVDQRPRRATAPTSVPRPPTATQITDLDRVGRRELAGIDDADLRHVERAGDAGHAGRERRRRTACSARRGSRGSACGSRRRGSATSTLPSLRARSRAADAGSRSASASAVSDEQRRRACRRACTLKPRMSLKSVRPLLPPKPMSLRKKASSSA